ncbi:unnamed protein product [Mytilus coruscus]|uniref:Uncharacterized protein n=1 Tax=Mytilus coruscus TaxID=42192 RepID=A0A6J8CVR8_MYTCO|nr:unnamed protein product [Mytilus coruscus]
MIFSEICVDISDFSLQGNGLSHRWKYDSGADCDTRRVPDIFKHMIKNWFPTATVERMIKTDIGIFFNQISPAENKIIQSLKFSQYMKVDGPLMDKIIKHFKLIQEPTKGWGKIPEANHINQGDDAERMRKLRNDYVHEPNSTISDEKFHDFFNKSIEIAGRLY